MEGNGELNTRVKAKRTAYLVWGGKIKILPKV
jgi:hypothetical protein